MDAATIVGIVQGGGVLALSLVVWSELRAMRTEAREDRREMMRMYTSLHADVIRLGSGRARTGPGHEESPER